MRVLLFLLLLLAVPAAWADEGQMEGGGMMMRVEVPRGFLDLTQASVLASPGTPSSLQAHLPRKPKTLRWPLPAGPLLLLGLPATDEAARDVMEGFQLLDDADDLAGGYAIWAWESDGRPIVVLLAADPAAMFAARFEFEATAPAEMINPNMRTVNLKGSDGSSAVLVRQGQRAHRPAKRVRGWAPTVPLTMTDAFACAGAHINHLWVTPKQLEDGMTRRALGRAKRLGIALTLFWRDTPPSPAAVQHAKRLGMRDVAVLSPVAPTQARRDEVRASFPDASVVFVHRPETPRGLTPRGAHLYDVQSPDGAVQFLFDAWNAFDNEPSYVPSAPTADATGSILAGDRFELERLAALWDPTRVVPSLHDAVAACFGVDPDRAEPYLKRAAATLRTRHAAQPWARAIAKDLDVGASVLVPIVPAATAIDDDDTLDERAWAFAARDTLLDWEVLAVSDGRVLYLAVRPGEDVEVGTRVSLRLEVNDRNHGTTVPDHANLQIEATAARSAVVYRFDRDRLLGAAHAGRILTLHGEADGSASEIALVVVP